MGCVLKIHIKALSNLFIGGAPKSFEIGGIDQWTVMDGEGFPYIPASSLKGALRSIVMKDASEEASEIALWYKKYLKTACERAKIFYESDTEAMGRLEERFKDAINQASAFYLFGIREFNDTPKLFFNDLRLTDECRDLKKCFSIDSKTSIDCNGSEPKSNPRTYKAIRTGMEFEGVIEFYGFGHNEEFIEKSKAYISKNLEKFNSGIYRLGNSKSRGYGKISVTFPEQDGGGKDE